MSRIEKHDLKRQEKLRAGKNPDLIKAKLPADTVEQRKWERSEIDDNMSSDDGREPRSPTPEIEEEPSDYEETEELRRMRLASNAQAKQKLAVRKDRERRKKASQKKKTVASKNATTTEGAGPSSTNQAAPAGALLRRWVDQRLERDNSFRGITTSWSLYWSPKNNRVLAGAAAVAASKIEHNLVGAYVIGRNPYISVPRGFPENMQQVHALHNLATGSTDDTTVAHEAWLLLQAFTRLSTYVVANHRDDAMNYVVTHARLFLGLPDPLDDTDPARQRDPVYRNDSMRATNRNNSTGGAGLNQPSIEDIMNPRVTAQYQAHHGRPGLQNMAPGIAMDRSHAIDLRTLWGFMLQRSIIAATGRNRAAQIDALIRIIYLPGYYQEYVQRYNAETTEDLQVPFTFTTTELSFSRMSSEDDTLDPWNRDRVLEHLVTKRIPVQWIHHVYPYALWWVRHQLSEGHIRWENWREIDDERLRRLAQYGVPPRHRPWGGWWIPSISDQTRISWLRDLELARGTDVYQDRRWLDIGEEVIFTYMPGSQPSITVPTEPTEPLALRGFTEVPHASTQEQGMSDGEDDHPSNTNMGMDHHDGHGSADGPQQM
jgi:hypothetical protein